MPLEPIRVFMNMCSALKGLKEEHLSNLLNEIKNKYNEVLGVKNCILSIKYFYIDTYTCMNM